jgi:DNA-binding HxlR family transcriptional regulator
VAEPFHAFDPPVAEPTEWEMVQGTRLVVGLLASRWRVGALYLLATGTKRFSEVFYEIGEVSKKALTQTLRGLEDDGLVNRRQYAEVPVRVEYSLTPLGWSITGVLMSMYEWAAAHGPDIESARDGDRGDVPVRYLQAVPDPAPTVR